MILAIFKQEVKEMRVIQLPFIMSQVQWPPYEGVVMIKTISRSMV